MRRVAPWQLWLVVLLATLTIALYTVRWSAFPDPQLRSEMWRFLVGDIAFLFLQVLLVTIVIDGAIQSRRRDETREKLNMIVGAFFAQVGTGLLKTFAQCDEEMANVRADLIPSAGWTARDYARARTGFAAHEPRLELDGDFLAMLRDTLGDQRAYLLGLLSNQSLHEHGTFTDLLWAITHVSEELEARPALHGLPASDIAHLAVDVRRAYSALGAEWLGYLEHLQSGYPHLFSLVVRTNPLDPNASPIVAA